MLSKRLNSLAKYINKDDKVIDVGCDHALLDIFLIKNKIINNIIVSDINDKALNSGIKNIKKEKLDKYIDARLGNGLEVLNRNDIINTILISGMGTNTILKILDNNYIININKLIIQSNNDHYLLRNAIINNGFYIENEDFLEDKGKHYINIVFKKGNKKYSKKEIKYGPYLIKNKNYLEFELQNIIKIKNIIPKMKLKYKFSLLKEEKMIRSLINKC